ncbi:hypothetical protein C0Q70_00450 [Pomacea canaliculata]|uniref:Uncharacterized protein n=1 Tax=Pomacea canaliculata TaxID=400727 RepID=A0A2T7PWS8_POMCA|nr:hypothetical protein C0Q70_00450 [Pomacea canaliculata]
MKILHTIRETPANPNGLCALSVTNESSYLAYPGSNTRGEVQIFDTVNLRAVTMIQAHTGTLAALAFNVQGNKLATASDKGTVIRVFSIPDGHRIFEFRRGMKRQVCVTIYSLSFSSDGMYLCASSNTETVHVFKLELPKEKPPDEANTWMDMMGNVFKSSASYLPAQVSEMLSQGRSFAIARLPMAGLKNVCAIATIQKLPRLLVASQDGYLYIYNLDPNEGKECGLVKQHRLDGVSSETSAGDQQPHDRPLTHPTSGGATATGASPPASYAATARRTDLPAVSQPVGTTGKPLASPAAHWTGGESYAQILKRNGGPQELDTVAMLDQLLEEPGNPSVCDQLPD